MNWYWIPLPFFGDPVKKKMEVILKFWNSVYYVCYINISFPTGLGFSRFRQIVFLFSFLRFFGRVCPLPFQKRYYVPASILSLFFIKMKIMAQNVYNSQCTNVTIFIIYPWNLVMVMDSTEIWWDPFYCHSTNIIL